MARERYFVSIVPYSHSLRGRMLVTLDTVALGTRVRRHPAHWRGRWKDDGVGGVGIVIGFVDATGALHGQDSGREFETDRIGARHSPAWAVVRWERTGLASTYPIGSAGPLGKWWKGGACFSLKHSE